MRGPILSMDQVARADVRVVGNKASQLGKLASRGHAVPSFFVITTDLFDAIRADPRVRDLERRLASDGADESLSSELRTLVERVEMGTEAWTLIRDARRSLGSTPVAVRSSGVAEDEASTSLAGQLDTVLDVRDDEELGRAIRVVWSSVYSPRAVAYRRIRGMRANDLDLAVIVQALVAADVSGVLFTVDPTDAAMLAISATRGLAADLVAGRIDGDMYRVHRETLAIEGEAREAAVLSERDVARLATLGLRLEHEIDAPQDVEWAISDGAIFVLQARPITVRAAPRARRTVWDNANIVESFPGVTLPLTYSLARESYAAVYRQAARLAGISDSALDEYDADLERMIGLIRGRVYYRLDSWYALLSLLPGFAHNKQFMEQMMGVRESARWTARTRVRLTPFDIGRLLILLTRMTLLALTLGPRIRAFERMVEDVCGQHEHADVRSRQMSDLVERYEDLKRRIHRQWQAPILNDFLTMLFFGFACRLIARWDLDVAGALAGDLLRSGDMPSVEPARRVAAMAQTVRGDARLEALIRTHSDAELVTLFGAGTMPPELNDPIREYLDRFGHRCVQELKLEQPSLRDDPLPLFASVRAYIARPDVDLERSAERDRIARVAAEDRVRGRLAWPFGLPSPRLLFLNWIVASARRRVRDREQMRFARARVFGLARALFTGIGQRLADVGHLDDPRDVFYLTADEACGVIRGTATTADLRALVALRKSEYQTYRDELPLPDRFETSGEPSDEMGRLASRPSSAPASGELRGIPCCAGIARGAARLVTSAREETLQAGEILVARETDPGWVTIFPLAAGILIERGSPLSHSAIVARELGIPTIVGVRGLTAALSTGAVVEMDGGTGRIGRIG
jgi:phosphohistidine swiveling domain-containing protein